MTTSIPPALVLNPPDAIEQEIRAKGLTAPRITPADIEANIVEERYFTAADGICGASDGMDFTAQYSRFALLTFCVLRLKNGFIVTGESSCVSAESFDAAKGRKYARESAIEKIWPLMGYELRAKLAVPSDAANHRRPNPANGAPKPVGHNPVG